MKAFLPTTTAGRAASIAATSTLIRHNDRDRHQATASRPLGRRTARQSYRTPGKPRQRTGTRCSLAGLEVEQLNVLRRRNQVPSVPNLDLKEEVANERGYEAGGALLVIIANELADRYEMSRECAARVAAFSGIMFERWEEIAATSAEIASGEEPAREILFAVIDWPGVQRHGAKNRPAQKVAIGNLKEVADRHRDARTILAVSLTRCAALMRRRATKARINLDEFWKS